MEEEIRKAVEWVLNSGIQAKNGGVYKLFDNEKKEYGYIYPEVTGYFITTCINIHKILKIDKALEKAKKAAEFLIKNTHHSGGVYEKIQNGVHIQPLFSFDTGMCATGLLELYKMEGEKKYFDHAKKMVNFILSSAENEVGIPYPALKNDEPVLDTHWSRSFGCHLIKLCIPLKKYHDLTGDKKTEDLIENILEKLLPLFDGENFFVNSENKTTYNHASCYALEGLSFLYNSGMKDLHDVLIKGSQGIKKPLHDNTDTTAQKMRIWLYTDPKRFKKSIDNAWQTISTRQVLVGDKRSNGGFYYNDEKKNHINSCCTFFALQVMIWKNFGTNFELII